MNKFEHLKWNRRELIKLGLMAGGASMIGSRVAQACDGTSPVFLDQNGNVLANLNSPYPIENEFGCGENDKFPLSPFILNPFQQNMPIPQSLLPGYRNPDNTVVTGTETISRSINNVPNAWGVRIKDGLNQNIVSRPGPGTGDQDALGDRIRQTTDVFGIAGPAGQVYDLPNAGTHQLWTDGSGVSGSQVTLPSVLPNPSTKKPWFPMINPFTNLSEPLLYHIRVQVSQNSYTNSPVQALVTSQDGAHVAGQTYTLPPSSCYTFNGTFPGPMINFVYGRPVIVRFENDLDLNPLCLDRQDFGAPDWAFLTHQHNGHTAPESDGQPHHMTDHRGGYQPGEWVDNLYLGYPAGGDPAEFQSFLWFHDHRMHHTGANVYKGMVGLMPGYNSFDDFGDEANTLIKSNLHLPGRKSIDPADPTGSTFNVKYDIPFALYDVALDDGATPHQDGHNGCGEFRPEWWGKQYFRHFPNQGFVGDIFTVNGVAYPVLNVERRKYRLRFLDCSVSRIYQLWLMKGTPVAAPGTQGQWQLSNAQQVMQFTQIASEGGLLPNPIVRNSFELWPAKRREFVVDFSQYMSTSTSKKTTKNATKPGDVLYLVDSLQMSTGRKPDNFPGDPNNPNTGYLVPLVKIVIGNLPARADADVSHVPNSLRAMPTMLGTPANLPSRSFTLQRGSPANSTLPGSNETQWVINSLQFDPLNPLALPHRGNPEVWTTANGGGGWVHPMHMHYEEHHVLFRNGVPSPDALHPDDTGREDVSALYPSESVTFYRNFRTFAGKYVAHCHNLAHEDHNMMFGWAVLP